MWVLVQLSALGKCVGVSPAAKSSLFVLLPRPNGVHWLLQYPGPHSVVPLQEAQQAERSPHVTLTLHPLPEDTGAPPRDLTADAVVNNEYNYL